MVLFIGTHPFGPVIALLPGSSQVFLHRYVATLQLALVLLVGLGADELAERGAEWSAGRAPARLRRLRVPLAVVLCAMALAPSTLAARDLLGQDRSWVAQQQRADRTTGHDAAATSFLPCGNIAPVPPSSRHGEVDPKIR